MPPDSKSDTIPPTISDVLQEIREQGVILKALAHTVGELWEHTQHQDKAHDKAGRELRRVRKAMVAASVALDVDGPDLSDPEMPNGHG